MGELACNFASAKRTLTKLRTVI